MRISRSFCPVLLPISSPPKNALAGYPVPTPPALLLAWTANRALNAPPPPTLTIVTPAPSRHRLSSKISSPYGPMQALLRLDPQMLLRWELAILAGVWETAPRAPSRPIPASPLASRKCFRRRMPLPRSFLVCTTSSTQRRRSGRPWLPGYQRCTRPAPALTTHHLARTAWSSTVCQCLHLIPAPMACHPRAIPTCSRADVVREGVLLRATRLFRGWMTNGAPCLLRRVPCRPTPPARVFRRAWRPATPASTRYPLRSSRPHRRRASSAELPSEEDFLRVRRGSVMRTTPPETGRACRLRQVVCSTRSTTALRLSRLRQRDLALQGRRWAAWRRCSLVCRIRLLLLVRVGCLLCGCVC